MTKIVVSKTTMEKIYTGVSLSLHQTISNVKHYGQLTAKEIAV